MRTNNSPMHGNHRRGHQWHGHKWLQNPVYRRPASPTGLLRRPLGFKTGHLEPLGGRLRTEIRTTNNWSAVVRSLAPHFELISWLRCYFQVPCYFHVPWKFWHRAKTGLRDKARFGMNKPSIRRENWFWTIRLCVWLSVSLSVCPSCYSSYGELSRA